jgi:calcineurin-like phosphoesterase family protein
MTRYFQSDPHLGHVRILELEPRPFDDVTAMDQAVINRWNAKLRPGDQLWLVGDVAMGSLEVSLALLETVQADLVLVAGNHDRFHPVNRKADRWVERYAALSNVVALHATSTQVTLPGGIVADVCHFPFPPDARSVTHRDGTVEEDRFAQYRLEDRGQWLVHGHVHGQWRQRGRQINVGMDAWAGRLVSDDDLGQMIAIGPQDLDVLPWRAAKVSVPTPAGASSGFDRF